LLVAAVVLIQGLSRRSWTFVRQKAEKIELLSGEG